MRTRLDSTNGNCPPLRHWLMVLVALAALLSAASAFADAPVITEGDGPIAVSMDEDGSPIPFSLTLHATDNEDPGSSLTWSISSPASAGTADAGGTGASKSISYTPDPNYNGSDSFEVTVTDTNSDTDSVSVNVTIDSVNDPPVITEGPGPIPVDMDEDGSPIPFSLTLNATDVEDDDTTLTWSISSPASAGTADAGGTGASKSISYTPDPNYNGSDSFEVTVTDANSDTDSVTVNVTIDSVNDEPSATNLDQTKSYTEGDLGVTLDDIVVSDVDAAEQITAVLTLADPGAAGTLTAASGKGETYDSGTGVWTITGSVSDVNAALEDVMFLPETDYDLDTTVATHIEDDAGTGPTDGTITLDVMPVNDQVSATNLDQTHGYVEDDPSVALDDIVVSDVDTDEQITATLTLADAAAGVLTTSGTATYTPATGEWTVTDSVTDVTAALVSVAFEPAADYDTDTTVSVDIADGGEDGTVALTGTINLDVTPVNDAPVTPDFSRTTDEDTVLEIDLLDFVTDVDTDLSPPWNQPPVDENVSVDVSRATLGSVNVNILEGKIIYTPFADENGDDSFTYRVSDGELADTGTVSVTVTVVNDAPFAQNDSASVTPDEPTLSIDVLANDGDPDGSLDASTVRIVPGEEPQYGTAVADPDTGAITYTLDDTLPEEFAGEDSFIYEVYDDDTSNPLCATAAVTVLISPAQFVVDSLLDEKDDDISEGNLSLREAIAFIMDEGTIEFDPDLFAGGQQTITLQEPAGELVINKSMTIRGPGADLLVISGDGLTRVFAVNSGTVTIEHLTVAAGHVVDGHGAGVYVGADAAMTLRNCQVSDNDAADENIEYDDFGGGIYNAGTLEVVSCTISGNTADAYGGGIYNTGFMAVTNSTVSGNTATGMDGGGILVAQGGAAIANCTITNNTAVGGGGLTSEQSGITTVDNSIIAGNRATGGPDVQGIITSNGHNLVGNSEGSADSFDGDRVGIEAASAIDTVLRDNGGRLLTHSLLADSVAINAGDSDAVPDDITTDQRGNGFDRFAGSAVDIGAYEVHTFVVNTLEDTDDVDADGVDTSPDSLSLREAIALTFPGDTVTFDVSGPEATIELDPVIGGLSVDSNLAVVGPGTDQLTISGGGVTQILYIPSVDVDVVISGLTFQDAYDNERGGAVIYNFGTVRVTDCVFTGNRAEGLDGGAIHNRGTMTLTDCVLHDNVADNLGGAIVGWGGTLVLNGCVLTDNEAAQMGGAIHNMLGGTVALTSCSLSGNIASLNGGAIYNSIDSTLAFSGCTLEGNAASSDAGAILNAGTLTLTNSTLSGNTAGRNGGGLYQTAAEATVTNCTITANLADSIGNGFAEGGGICHSGGVLNLHNTIVAGNSDTVDNTGLGNVYPDVSGTVTSLGSNIIGNGNGTQGVTDGLNGDRVGTATDPIDPALGPLAGNGGSTRTHALGVGSAAIDAGDDLAVVAPAFAGPPFFDQRGDGYSRLVDGDGDGETHVDIGALEFMSSPPTFASVPATESVEDSSYTYEIAVTDPDANDLFTIEATELPAWLTLDDHGDGTATLSGTPTNDDVGSPYDVGLHEVVLQVTDWASKTGIQEFTIEVTGVNDPPSLVDDSVSTDEDVNTTVAVLEGDSDVDGSLDASTLHIVGGQGPTHGTVTVATDVGTVTYTPDPDFNGTDSFVYEVFDDGTPLPALSATAVVTVTVDPVNDEPVAVADVAATNEDTPVTVSVLDNDSDVDGNLVPEIVIVAVAPSNGTADVDTTTGAVTYIPNPNFYGFDTFEYRVFDDGSPIPPLSSDATVAVTVIPVNDPPSPADDSVTTQEDTAVEIDVLVNDLDIDSNLVPGSVTVVNAPANGSFIVNGAAGTVTYIPDQDFSGTDSFVYEVSDDGQPVALSATATVAVSVEPVNDAPVTEDDLGYTLADTGVTIDVLANDSDTDGSLDPTSVSVILAPSNGTAAVDPETGTITYTPNPAFEGTDSFVYGVFDTGTPLPEESSTAAVTVEVVSSLGPPRTFYVDVMNSEPGDGSRDNPFPTIGAAVSATTAFQGDTIRVMPGEYVESVRLKPDCRLVSVDGAFHTLISGPDSGAPLVTVDDGCVVRGFTAALGPTAVRLVIGATAEVTNCVLDNCQLGVYASAGSQLVLNNNTIYGNSSFGLFAGENAALGSVKNNIFFANEVGISVAATAVADGGFNILFDNGQDYDGLQPFENDLSVDPRFVDEAGFNFHLSSISPARDAGDPDPGFLDLDGTRNDIGSDGGPNGVTDDLVPAPVIVTSPSPAYGDPPFTVLFDGSESWDEWGIASYSWDFDEMDGFQVEATGPIVQCTFDEPGTYNVTLLVVDNNDLVNVTSAEVTVDQPPTVTVSRTPRAGPAPVTVEFGVDAFDPDGGLVAYSWDFEGTGRIDSTAVDPQHTYSEAGGYMPSVTVTDDEGAVTRVTLPVTVTIWRVHSSAEIDGYAGGRVIVDDVFSLLHAASVDIPPGALSEPTVITIGLAAGPPADNSNVLLVPCEIGPAETLFSEIVTVTVPVADQFPADRLFAVKYFDAGTQVWTTAGIRHIRRVELDAGPAIQFQIGQSGLFAIVTALEADIDGDGQVNALDVQLVVNCCLGIDIGLLNADVNFDGRVDAVDVQMTINAVIAATQ